MFIEKIIIECFKTFGASTSLGPFFPGTNILVGYNGSGKTSILNAIEFIFHDDYKCSSEEEFNKLICHDTRKKNNNVISVEIIFNNSDLACKDLPPQFSIKRQLSLKKDTYIFKQKNMSRKEFLESISNSEIDISTIRQGELLHFSTLSDKERLKLLFKMICYSQSTDESRSHDWDAAIETRNKTMEQLKQLYNKLKEEHQRYEDFQKVLSKKEWISYGMEKKKLMLTKEKIEQLEQKISAWVTRQSEETTRYYQLKSEFNILESQLTENYESLRQLENTETKVNKVIKQLETEKEELETSICISEQNNEERENALKEMNEKFESLEVHIKCEMEIIDEMKSELSSIFDYIKELERQYEDEMLEFNYLDEKLSKKHKPDSKEARDKSIRETIEELQKSIAKKRLFLKQYLSEEEEKNKKVMELNDKILSVKSEMEDLKISQQNFFEELKFHQKKLKAATDISRTVTAQIEEASEKKSLLQNHYEQNRKKLYKVLHRDVIQYKTAVENAMESFNNENPEKERIDVSKYHGFVVDCFEYDSIFNNVILAVADKKLFNFLFDSAKDSVKMLMKVENDVYPTTMNMDIITLPKKSAPSIPDTVSLISKITYKPAYKKLAQSLFGSFIICRDKKAALKIRNKKKVNCVTLDGGVFYSTGLSVAGNWKEDERNQIEIYKAMSKHLALIKKIEEDINNFNRQKSSCANYITDGPTQINILELKMKSNQDRMALLECDLNTFEYELRFNTVDDDEHEEIVQSIERLTRRVEHLQLKLNSDDQEEITSDEYQRYEELKISMENLLKSRIEQEKKAKELKRKITFSLDILKETYLEEKNHLQKNIRETTEAKEMDADLIKSQGIELKRKIEILENEYKKLEDVQKTIKIHEKIIKEMEVTKKERECQTFNKKINVGANVTDINSLQIERDELLKIIVEAQENMKEFSDNSCMDPDPELKDLENLTMQQLRSLEDAVNKELKEISFDIDENASEIFSRLQEATKTAKATMSTLDKDKARVALSMKKYELALKKQVWDDLVEINQHLNDIVKRFMPYSQTELILMTKNEDYSVNKTKDAVELDDLTGVNIKFTQFEDIPAQSMNELSGGQTSIIALSFMFAIRKCWSLPFFLCDEIDQALDIHHQTVMHKNFKELKAKAQIFITTFRPEILESGDHFYHVKKDGVSAKVIEVNKEKALNFLKSVKQG